MSSLERILPFLSPIRDLLVHPDITEVMVNAGGHRVFVERGGIVERIPMRTVDEKLLTVAIKNIARTCGDEISEEQQFSTPAWKTGRGLRRCCRRAVSTGRRSQSDAFPADTYWTIWSPSGVCRRKWQRFYGMQSRRHNVLISGGTGNGKTTLLNALAAISDSDRIALIEETSEILLEKPNYVRFEARRARAPFGGSTGVAAVTIADLLRATLRHRPDRIIVGEVRGAEAFDLLQALNTGHLGSMTTIHSHSAEQALTRLAHCVVAGTVGLPHSSIQEAIALAIHPIVHIARDAEHSRITEVIAVRRYEAQSDRFVVEHLYTHRSSGR